VKVGLIGCGAIVRAHIEALRRLRGVDVVATCDTDEARAQRVAEKFGIRRAYRSATELLKAERPDVVHILTPPQSHRDLSIAALQAGCDVFVEKPMAVDAAEAGDMVEASRRLGKTLGVCHNFLFDPALLEARELVASGALGRVVGAEVFWKVFVDERARDRFTESGWRHGLPGGVVHDVSAHPVYLLREFLGTLTVVSSVIKAVDGVPPPSTELRALFDGERGLGSAAVSFCSSPWQRAVRVYGTEMTVHADLAGHVLVREHKDPRGGHARQALANLDLGAQLATRTAAAAVAGLRKPEHRGHATVIERFYEALRDGRPPPVSGEDGRAVLSLLDRLWAALPPPVATPA
jgi:2-alkyl-3-oxoalkanoate reductase